MDIHSHRCRHCGKVWTHDGDVLQERSKAAYDAAHECCGEVERSRYSAEIEQELGPELYAQLVRLRELFA